MFRSKLSNIFLNYLRAITNNSIGSSINDVAHPFQFEQKGNLDNPESAEYNARR